MHGNVSTGITAGNPLCELLAGDRLGFQQRTIAAVHMLQDIVIDQGPHLFVIGIEQFVVHHLGSDIIFFSQRDQLVQFLQLEDRRLFHNQMCARFQQSFTGIEVTVVGRSNAGEVQAGRRHLFDRVFAGEALEATYFVTTFCQILLRP